MLACPLGILNRRFVIPAAATCDFADAGRVDLDGGFRLFVARPGARASPDRELIDLCRSVMEARIHCRLSC